MSLTLRVSLELPTYTIGALVGSGVNRCPRSLVVQVHNGGLYDAEWGNELIVTAGGVLAGWGGLDGPSCRLDCGQAWDCNVPVSEIERIERLSGQSIRIIEDSA